MYEMSLWQYLNHQEFVKILDYAPETVAVGREGFGAIDDSERVCSPNMKVPSVKVKEF